MFIVYSFIYKLEEAIHSLFILTLFTFLLLAELFFFLSKLLDNFKLFITKKRKEKKKEGKSAD